MAAVDRPNKNPFIVGQLVHVDSRTWPGINQPGGVGRVIGTAGDRVSVQYVVGHRRCEKEIPVQYVHAQNVEGSRSLRNRSMLLGRCSNCGSLRTDCGSCDVVVSSSMWMAQQHNENSNNGNDDNSSSSDDDDDDDSLQGDLEEQARLFRRYQRIRKRRQKMIEYGRDDGSAEDNQENNDDNEANSSSSGGDDNDSILEQLAWQESQPHVRAMSASARKRKRRRRVIDDDDDDDSITDVRQPSVAPTKSDGSDGDGSVSNPGTPDMSQLTQKQPLTPPREIRTADDNSPMLFSDNERDDVVMEHEKDQITATQNEFIQPEGDGTDLPADILNRSASVEYKELGPFFDRLVEEIETKRLAKAQAQVTELEEKAKAEHDREELLEERYVKQLPV